MKPTTRILIALKYRQLDRRELPDTLEASVTDYLDTLPLDDFDGKPMKYSKEKKVVYAVGTDLVDNRGRLTQDGHEDLSPEYGYDLVYKINF
ncbi:MAG: hypothetical protein JW889_15200 [Verrucomicrobia bacterium]|nr:hypothetical protein [Verrucomicrobiota bacterium]